jgi:hypothetical protein
MYWGGIDGRWCPNHYWLDWLGCTWRGLLGLCALDPVVRPFHVAFCGGGAWIEVLEDKVLVKFGHPFRKPLCTAFDNVEFFGLHNNWCANFTPYSTCMHGVHKLSKVDTGMYGGANGMQGTINISSVEGLSACSCNH